jgi:multidrug efflux pump subunit AcrB
VFSRFFIDRPIFASVLSILITLAGGIAVFNLPLAQFPAVAPPTIQVTCNYPGASAQDVADSVAVPIEQQVNGVEGMMYMSSACTNDGTYSLTITFRQGTDQDMAHVLVQNRVALAIPLLPDVIKQTGVTVRKRSPAILMGFAITSPDGTYDQLYLSNYTIMQIKDELTRVEGVGDIFVLGQRDYSMRVWLDPGKIAARGLTAMDVARAIREENNQVAVGQIGQPPAGTAQQLQIPLTTLGRLGTVEQFENIIVKADRGRFVRLKDITRDAAWRITLDRDKLFRHQIKNEDIVRALRKRGYAAGTDRPLSIAVKNATRELTSQPIRETPVKSGKTILTVGDLTEKLEEERGVELGAKNQDIICRFNRQSTAFLAVFQTPDANALAVRDRLIARMNELKRDFPKGVDYSVAFDTTPYTRESINEVFKTLRDAIILVAAVVLLFLQNWRSALIPLAAVPVAIIGTFAIMAGFGFSLNNLTLFGLVLAIGIVVDDAIVVVEAVEHHIEHGMKPREATIKAMDQVSGPVIAVGLVLSAVFIPCAFISGITGQFFRQFALTIAVSTLISAFNSLTLSPALCALLLKPRQEGHTPMPRLAFVLAGTWAAWTWLGPLAIETLGRALEFLPAWAETVRPALPWVANGGCILLGAVAGWLAGRVANALLRWFFRMFNAGFVRLGAGYTRLVGFSLAGHASVLLLVLMVAGGALAWKFLGPLAAGWLAPALPYLPAKLEALLQPVLPWVAAGLSALVGAALALLAVWGTHRLLTWLLTRERISRTSLARFYPRLVGFSLPLILLALLGYAGMVGLTGWSFRTTPKGFIPSGDMGYLMINVLLPDSASLQRTREVMKQIEDIAKKVPGVRHVTTISGQSFVLNAYGSNFGSSFLNLQDFQDRRDPRKSSEVIANTLRRKFAEEILDAQVAVFGPPPVRGAGRAGGFMLMVEDRADAGSLVLQKETEALVDEVRKQKGITGAFSVFRANVPQIKITPDPAAVMKKNVDLASVAGTLRIYQGSLYVNDFNRFGRTWQVIVQADAAYRDEPEKLGLLKIRNKAGGMIPARSLGDYQFVNGPLVLTRYNMYPAASINGTAVPGMSSGDVIAMVQHLAESDLAPNMSFEWTDMSYLELLAGNTAMIIFACAVVMVFLVLAAQYESWSLPLAVILVVPLCLLCSIAGVNVARMDINIFTQIGFVVLVGLASKNAILIVEFAKKQREAGIDRQHATLEACRLRLRPIVMTSLAFILGVVPLITSKGAGSEMRRTLGTAVFSGMLGVTLFGLFLTPVFFYVIDYLSGKHLFASPRVHRIGTAIRDIVTLRFLWLFGRLAWQGATHRGVRPEPVAHRVPVNGAVMKSVHGNGEAEVHGSKGEHVQANGTPVVDSDIATPARERGE